MMESVVSCDWLINELGPPPDAILRIPPPPVPHFMVDLIPSSLLQQADRNSASNESDCHWCHWARRMESAGTISGGAQGTGTSLYI